MTNPRTGMTVAKALAILAFLLTGGVAQIAAFVFVAVGASYRPAFWLLAAGGVLCEWGRRIAA